MVKALLAFAVGAHALQAPSQRRAARTTLQMSDAVTARRCVRPPRSPPRFLRAVEEGVPARAGEPRRFVVVDPVVAS